VFKVKKKGFFNFSSSFSKKREKKVGKVKKVKEVVKK
jgi:hypothetical protein